MKIGFATGDFVTGSTYEDGKPILGGAGHIRLAQYLPYIGHNVRIGELLWDADTELFGVRDWDGVEHLDCDVVVFQRWMHRSIPDRIKVARALGQVIFNECDDWYWGLDESNLAFLASHPKVAPDENVNWYRKSIIAGDAVIISTDYLRDRFADFVDPDRLILLENHVEIDKFTPRLHLESERPMIGWFGSTIHRSRGDMHVLKKLAGTIGTERWMWHHSGHVNWHPHFDDELGLTEGVSTSHSKPPANLQELMVFDIGVVPLGMTPFNEAKSWIKGIEYAAAGIPFIATPTSAYKKLKSKYGIGRLAKNTKQWVNHLEELRDPEVRQQEAEANLKALAPLDVRYGAARWDGLFERFT